MDQQNLSRRIVSDPKIMGGKPIIKGTRLTVEFILGLLANETTKAEILGEYDYISAEDIQACQMLADQSEDLGSKNFDVVKILLFDKHDRLFIYLRDDKPTIPYPNMWDLLGGGIELGESAKEAGRREIEEEIGITVTDLHKHCQYTSEEGFRFQIFWGKAEVGPEEVILTEGQRLTSIKLESRNSYQIVPILKRAIDEFVEKRGSS